jgi:hypothetical protein
VGSEDFCFVCATSDQSCVKPVPGCFVLREESIPEGVVYRRYACSMSVNRLSVDDHKKTSYTKRVNVKHPTLHNRLYEPRCTAERQTDDRDVPRRKKEKEWKLSVQLVPANDQHMARTELSNIYIY